MNMGDSAEVVTDLMDGKERKEEVNQYEGSCVKGPKGSIKYLGLQ